MKTQLKKVIISITCLLLTVSVSGQSVYERIAYSNNSGVMEFKDVILTVSATDIVDVGNFKNNFYLGGRDHGILSKCSSTGNIQWFYEYEAQDYSGKNMHMVLHSLTRVDSNGYILVGSLNKASNKHVAIPGEKDVLILRVNNSGQVTKSIRVDIDGRTDVGYSIVPKDESYDEFIICGTTKLFVGASSDGFLMEIDDQLNVNWLKEIELRNTSSLATKVDLYDLTMDGDSIWAVGSIVDTNSVNTNALVVHFATNGTYINSRRAGNSVDREVFYHVENDDASHLIITGTSANVAFGTPLNRMIALRYNKASNNVPLIRYLKTQIGTTFIQNIGYDINKHSTGGGGYFVVGATTPVSGNSVGVFQHLDNSLIPISQYIVTSSGNVGLRALVVEEGSENIVVSSGSHVGGTNIDGYEMKSNFSGFTGCNDSIGVFQDSLTLRTDSLLWELYDTYLRDTLYVVSDSLIDSLLCVDSLNFGYNPNPEYYQLNQTEEFYLYPNPVKVGNPVEFIAAREENVVELILFDLRGNSYKVDFNQVGSRCQFETRGLSTGLYGLKLILRKPDGQENVKFLRIMILAD